MVTIIRRFNGEKIIYKLRKEDRKLLSPRFRTMNQAKKYAASLGLKIIERPDLVKKWNSPRLNKSIA